MSSIVSWFLAFRVRFLVLFGGLSALGLSPLCGADAWRKTQTEHFIVYSSYSDRATRHYLTELENARRFFEARLGAGTLPRAPQVVIALKSEEEFRQFRRIHNALADLIRTESANYMVLTGLSFEPRYELIHEYARCLLRYRYSSLPWWLENGAAEVYSAVHIAGPQTKLGGELINRAKSSYVEPIEFIDVRNLVRMDNSVIGKLNNHSQAIAAGESWAFVQMLMLSKTYAPQFETLLDRIACGEDSETALEKTYHCSFHQVQADFTRYFERGRWAKLRISVPGPQYWAKNPTTRVSQVERAQIVAELRKAMDEEEGAKPGFATRQLDAALRKP